MEYSLTHNERIYGILRLFINEPCICKDIITYKKHVEEVDNLEYHYNRWKHIACSYHILCDTQIQDNVSMVFDSNHFVVKLDHTLNFYNVTGISYQVICLIQELIKLKNTDLIANSFITDYKQSLHYDDKLYSELSKKIMSRINE